MRKDGNHGFNRLRFSSISVSIYNRVFLNWCLRPLHYVETYWKEPKVIKSFIYISSFIWQYIFWRKNHPNLMRIQCSKRDPKIFLFPHLIVHCENEDSFDFFYCSWRILSVFWLAIEFWKNKSLVNLILKKLSDLVDLDS